MSNIAEITAAIRAALDAPGLAGAFDFAFAANTASLRVLLDELDAQTAQRLTLQHHAADMAQREAGLERELETERIRLAACGVFAISDTPESAAKARQMLPIYESASASDVARRVDECIALRQRVADLEAERDELRAKLDACAPHLRERPDGTLESPADMLALREREALELEGEQE